MRRARGAFGQAVNTIAIPDAFHGSVPPMKLSAADVNAQASPGFQAFDSAIYALFVLWLFDRLPIPQNPLILQGPDQIQCP